MCITIKTNEQRFLVNYGMFFIALKTFRVIDKKLVGLWQYNAYQGKKICANEPGMNEKIIRIEIEPNNQLQDIELEFNSLNSLGAISRYTKKKQANLGYHAVFFTDFLKNHLLRHFIDNVSLVFDMMPIVFGYEDIQAIDHDSIVIEKFSIQLDISFYEALAKKLSVDDSVTINQWIKTLHFFKENLDL